MSTINTAKKRTAVKIVYYGPGLSGKTANLRAIYAQLAPNARGRLVSRSVGQRRSLWVDMLAIKTGMLKGFPLACHLCTVPGHAPYSNVRQILLKGVDGVVFVADSQRARMAANLDSMDDLKANLLAHHVQLYRLPHVLQYNKRDLPDAVDMGELGEQLNKHHVPEFPAIATKSEGVMETLAGLLELILRQI